MPSLGRAAILSVIFSMTESVVLSDTFLVWWRALRGLRRAPKWDEK